MNKQELYKIYNNDEQRLEILKGFVIRKSSKKYNDEELISLYKQCKDALPPHVFDEGSNPGIWIEFCKSFSNDIEKFQMYQ